MEGHKVAVVIAWACTNLVVIPDGLTTLLDTLVKKPFRDHLKKEYMVVIFLTTSYCLKTSHCPPGNAPAGVCWLGISNIEKSGRQ